MKLREGDPIIDRFEPESHLEADVHQVRVRNYQIAKHFNPALQ